MAAMPLMPKATAVWLVENTTLTFEQIAEFCGLHKLEVQAIADGEAAIGIVGMDPIVQTGQLTAEEIKRCENDPRARLKMVKSDLPQPVTRTKGPRYTPVSKRADRPDAIAYLIKTYPELLDAQVARLVGTTKDTIAKVRSRTHWNSNNIKPHNPVLLGLCKQSDLDSALRRAQRRVAREQAAAGITPETAALETEAMEQQEQTTDLGSQDQPELDADTMFRGMG
ncbi:MAG: cell cycle transcriptional regulator TrcR [Alphaproteobacteria bacterium]|nr:cell cycle transcriptional regulator TrcR [Alphaproteobacteria bacterium]